MLLTVIFCVNSKMSTSGAANEYLAILLQPYRDELARATTVESIEAWIPQIFGDYSDSVLESIRIMYKHHDPDMALEDVRAEVIEALEGLLTNGLDWSQPILPWDLVKNRDDFTTQLFGPATDVVPVTVTINGTNYQHLLTQDLYYGILSVAGDNNQQLILSIADAQLSLNDFGTRYQDNINAEYQATISTGTVFFNGSDVIRGVMTAAQWLGADPHIYVRNFVRLSDNTPMTF